MPSHDCQIRISDKIIQSCVCHKCPGLDLQFLQTVTIDLTQLKCETEMNLQILFAQYSHLMQQKALVEVHFPGGNLINEHFISSDEIWRENSESVMLWPSKFVSTSTHGTGKCQV